MMGGCVVIFSDGTKVMSLLLVGVNGARSCVRKQLLPHRESMDTEGRCLYGF